MGELDSQRGGEKDEVFVKTVLEEVTNFVQGDVRNSLLLFPVLPKHERFLTHTVVEENFDELCSFSLGQSEFRRTAVCLKSRLIFAFDSGYCLDSSARRLAVRLCREKGLPVDFLSHSIRNPPSASKKMQAPASRPARRQRRPDMQLYVPRGRKAEAPKTVPSAASLQEQMPTSHSRFLPGSQSAASETASTLDHCEKSVGILQENASSEHGCVAEISTQPCQAGDVCGMESGAECTGLDVDSNCDVLSTSANSEHSEGVIQVCLSLSQENDTANSEEIADKSAEEIYSLPEPLSATTECEGLPEREDVRSLEDGAGFVDDSDVGISEQTERVTLKEPSSVLRLRSTQLCSEQLNASGNCANLAETSTGDNSGEAEDSWDALFDESGDSIDPGVLKKITKALGNIKVHQAELDYTKFEPRIPDLSEAEYGHILEIYNFPAEFETKDLVTALSSSKDQFNIKWVDDTHALAIFSSPFAEFLMPYKPRPQTSASVARRLVSGALGMRVNVDAEQRKKERQILQEAKGKRITAAKQRVDVWNGDV